MKSNPVEHNKRLRIENLSADLFKQFYDIDTVPYTVKGFAFFVDDKLVSIGGVRYGGAYFTVFSDIKEGADVNAATIFRCCKHVMKMVEDMNIETVAIANEITSPTLLNHLGFTFYDLMNDYMIYKKEKKHG